MSFRFTALPLLIAAALLGACSSHPFDVTQLPRVSISTTVVAVPPTISWQPAGAQLVRVYRGATAGDGYSTSLMWSIASNAENSLESGVTYGATTPVGGSTDVPSKPLVAGETYTVQVTRQDPKGTGDGFTNTRHRYVGTATFTMP